MQAQRLRGLCGSTQCFGGFRALVSAVRHCSISKSCGVLVGSSSSPRGCNCGKPMTADRVFAVSVADMSFFAACPKSPSWLGGRSDHLGPYEGRAQLKVLSTLSQSTRACSLLRAGGTTLVCSFLSDPRAPASSKFRSYRAPVARSWRALALGWPGPRVASRNRKNIIFA